MENDIHNVTCIQFNCPHISLIRNVFETKVQNSLNIMQIEYVKRTTTTTITRKNQAALNEAHADESNVLRDGNIFRHLKWFFN